MNRVLSIEGDGEFVQVQAGCVLAVVNRRLQSKGRFFAPDPATRSITTIGGALALNLTGSHWVRYGSPRDKVISLKVVLATGELVEIASQGQGRVVPHEDAVAVQTLRRQVAEFIGQRREQLELHRPQTEINQAGYNLYDLDAFGAIDLTRLIVGSSGTLALITEARLATAPIPKYRGVALMFFDSLDSAAKVSLDLRQHDISACDLLDRRLLSLARETNAELARLIPTSAEAMLLVECQSEHDSELRDHLARLSQFVRRRRNIALDVRTTTQIAERNLFWRLTRRVTPTLYRLRGSQRAVPLIDDLAVAPEKLPEFLVNAHRICHKHEVTVAVFSHVPQGIVRLHPLLDMSRAQGEQQMQRLATEIFDEVLRLRGSISGSFGDGLTRTWYLRRQFGPLYSAMVDIKNAFDPDYLLNPGKIIDHPPTSLTEHLRSAQPLTLPDNSNDATETPASTALPVVEPQLNWTIDEMALTARNCNGCARCRNVAPDQRMCPMFRADSREEAAPRSKANLFRGVITGQIPIAQVASDEFRTLTDLCFNCHQCRLECPASADIPKLMIEAKAQHVAVKGLNVSDWLTSRLDIVYEWAGRMPRIANAIIRNRWARWVIERMFGIALSRKLPRFSDRSFLRWAAKSKLNKSSRQQGRKVVFFVDAFVNWNDLELGQALVRVFQHNGIDVVVPPDQMVSGMSLISEGILGRARKLAAKNVEYLSEFIRQGYRVVTTEPAAALALKHEYLHLIDDADARLVADHTDDACHYLWQLHLQGNLELNFHPINAVLNYHTPCHLKALQIGTPGLNLMRLIPGLQVEGVETGCSGMAGTYGLKRKNLVRSLRIGRHLIAAIRDGDCVAGATECNACRMQMEYGTTKPTVHPLKVLALAYRLLP
ncbi:MAG TPA: anaerobic glycerol-3-phosphate dehydrogenase subunit C, partial [Pirellulaceae bacterium]|nr:anaerobic glycerol-3-phosphate dehydrogenase subunit C [Pirellulaceae bacterium]